MAPITTSIAPYSRSQSVKSIVIATADISASDKKAVDDFVAPRSGFYGGA